MRRERISFALLVGMQTGAATSMEVPQKIKNRTTLRPCNCTARYLSKGYRYAVSKGHMHPSVYSSTIINSQIWKEPKCPSMDEWIKKMCCVCVCVCVCVCNVILLGNPKE